MRATSSVRPKCSQRCLSLKEFPLKAVQNLKHATTTSTEQTSMVKTYCNLKCSASSGLPAFLLTLGPLVAQITRCNRNMYAMPFESDESHTPKTLAMRTSFLARDVKTHWLDLKSQENARKTPVKILRFWPAMRKIGVFFRSSDAKCLRFRLLLWFGLPCELLRRQSLAMWVERCEPPSSVPSHPLVISQQAGPCHFCIAVLSRTQGYCILVDFL